MAIDVKVPVKKKPTKAQQLETIRKQKEEKYRLQSKNSLIEIAEKGTSHKLL